MHRRMALLDIMKNAAAHRRADEEGKLSAARAREAAAATEAKKLAAGLAPVAR